MLILLPYRYSIRVKPLLLELSPWRKKLDQITTALDEKSNFTDVVFVADFPGLMLENFVDPELNASITVLNGKVNIEVGYSGYELVLIYEMVVKYFNRLTTTRKFQDLNVREFLGNRVYQDA